MEYMDEVDECYRPHLNQYDSHMVYDTICIVENGNVPIVPGDVLRYMQRKYGVSIDLYANNTWVKIGFIKQKQWYNIHGEKKIECIKPHPYEVPIRVTIHTEKRKQKSLTDMWSI
tara:strand:+ start:356 stop:700 length:345 start_codon:yes stop_codon:yes gene_type:complete